MISITAVGLIVLILNISLNTANSYYYLMILSYNKNFLFKQKLITETIYVSLMGFLFYKTSLLFLFINLLSFLFVHAIHSTITRQDELNPSFINRALIASVMNHKDNSTFFAVFNLITFFIYLIFK